MKLGGNKTGKQYNVNVWSVVVAKATRHIAPAKKLSNHENNHTTFIILAAGVGKRMKTYGPKSLLSYKDDTTILDYQIKTIYEWYPKADIIVVVGFEYHKFVQYKNKYPSVRIVHNHIHDIAGTLYSTKLGIMSSVGSRVVVIHGDLIFSANAIQDLTSGKSKLVACNTIEQNSVGLVDNDGLVANISYGLDHKWGQITFFTGREYQLLSQLLYGNGELHRLYLYEGIKHVIDNDGQFYIHEPKGIQIYDIDSYKDLTLVKDINI
jgi:choline kinase